MNTIGKRKTAIQIEGMLTMLAFVIDMWEGLSCNSQTNTQTQDTDIDKKFFCFFPTGVYHVAVHTTLVTTTQMSFKTYNDTIKSTKFIMHNKTGTTCVLASQSHVVVNL